MSYNPPAAPRRRTSSLSLRESLLDYRFEVKAFEYISHYTESRQDPSNGYNVARIDSAIERFYEAYERRLEVKGCGSMKESLSEVFI
jgi:uncharacterized protein YecE (DUF72 family)